MQDEPDLSVWGSQSASLKRRAAIGLLGENSALKLADRYVDLRIWKEHALTRQGRADYLGIQKYQNAHAGNRCVIVGNGPSLLKTDLELLRGEITFGLNRIYLMFDRMGFETTYHVVANKYVTEQWPEDLGRVRAPLFTMTQSRDHLKSASNALFMQPLRGPRFGTNAAHGVWVGGTVTYVALQLAYYMGFTKIVLVGVDHRFAVSGPPNKLVVSDRADQSHFDPRYFGPGIKWQLPDLETSAIAYKLARHEFEKAGRQVLDGTVDGALDIFPKVPLAEALSN